MHWPPALLFNEYRETDFDLFGSFDDNAKPESAVAEPEFLKNVTLFIEFDADELEHLARSMHRSHFAPGDVILEEGNANRALHIVRSGRIRVTRQVNEREVELFIDYTLAVELK